VPSGTPIDFALAEQMYYEGDYDGALTIYSAAALNGTPEQKQTGLWAIARIQFQRGQHSDAESTARAFRATNPPSDLDRQALLLLGSVQLQQGELDAAKESFVAYVATSGPALPYAQLYLAQIDLGQGRPEQAIPRLNDVVAAGLPPQMNYLALSTLAQADEQKGDHTAGAADYRRAADAATTATEGAEALWYLADAANSGGDSATASEALGELIRTYPRTQRAADAAGDPRLAPGAVSAFDLGLLLFYQQRNVDATAALQPLADAGGLDAPAAQYYLGILSERVEDWNSALDHYDAAIALLADGSDDTLRAQSYWDIATVFERIGQTFDAIDNYAKVAEIQSTHAQASEGLFRAGFLAFNLGRYDDSLTHWQRLTIVAQKTEDKSRANYWLSAASEAVGDIASAEVYLQNSITNDPLDYYAMRANARINGPDVAPAVTTVIPATPIWTGVESWLRTWAGAEPPTPSTGDILASSAFLRAVELHKAGFTDIADEQWKALLDDNADKPWAEYRLLRAISDFDRPGITVVPALDLAEQHPGAPPELLRLAYPLAYRNLVEQEAEANGLSPLLLLALVRQESLYTPDAVSSVGATGLTQIVDTTAIEIAEQLGETDFVLGDLLRPNVALQFGAHYLGSALTGFEGAVPPAVAGYNAGPGTAAGWWEIAGANPDLFLETIDFTETRAFVELVLENYARYLYAYGVTDLPVLPLG
jgi:soluble lytic murein transglycosylase